MKNIPIFNFSIRNAATAGEVDIEIDGAIVDAETREMLQRWYGDETSVSFRSFRDQLSTVENLSRVNVSINSYGGHVGDAMAIHDLLVDLQNKGVEVNTQGRGIVASAATYILMAGRNSTMSENSWFMIHNVSGAIWGDVNTVENYAATLRKFNNATRDFYSKSTGIRKEEISKLMDAETWLTANEARNKGFIKNVSGSVEFSNKIDPKTWNFSNLAVLNAYNSACPNPAPANETSDINSQIKTHFEEMKKFFNSIVDAIRGLNANPPAEGAEPVNVAEQIASAIAAPFENLAGEIENQIATAVENQREAITNAIAAQIGEQYENRIAQLENAKTELEQDIVQLKGKSGTPPKGEDGPQPIGNFVRGAKA
jgi:ATP-dependent protease ClpP protease subunit